MKVLSHSFLTCLALVSYAAIGDSPAEPVSLFGLQLQRPLSLGECKFNRDIYIPGLPRANHYVVTVTAPCFKREHEADIGTKRSIEDDDYIVGNWPSKTLPKIALGDRIYIGVVEGNVEEIEFETLGVISQGEVLDALKAKFGKPNFLEVPICRDKFGATSRGISAGWEIGQVLVKFRSCPDGLERGEVDVRTQKWTAHVRQNHEKSEASKRP